MGRVECKMSTIGNRQPFGGCLALLMLAMLPLGSLGYAATTTVVFGIIPAESGLSGTVSNNETAAIVVLNPQFHSE